MKIPKLIHRIWTNKMSMPEVILDNIRDVASSNPGWRQKIYTDDDINDYVSRHYGPEISRAMNSISPKYAVCRADLFRYLVVYREGGVYLDAKSSLKGPLEELIQPDDEFLLSQWGSFGQEMFSGYGSWKELRHIPGGEYHQWHIISIPEHPFLKAVITNVLNNISNYNPWKVGAGQRGVLRMTGPIAYSMAIQPIRTMYPHRVIDLKDSILLYSAFDPNSHRNLGGIHYTALHEPIIASTQIADRIFSVFHNLQQKTLWKLNKIRQRVLQ